VGQRLALQRIQVTPSGALPHPVQRRLVGATPVVDDGPQSRACRPSRAAEDSASSIRLPRQSTTVPKTSNSRTRNGLMTASMSSTDISHSDRGQVARGGELAVYARRIDPRDESREIDRPPYRVYFWQPQGTADDSMWASDEWDLTDAADVTEVMSWAESQSGGPTGCDLCARHDTRRRWASEIAGPGSLSPGGLRRAGGRQAATAPGPVTCPRNAAGPASDDAGPDLLRRSLHGGAASVDPRRLAARGCFRPGAIPGRGRRLRLHARCRARCRVARAWARSR